MNPYKLKNVFEYLTSNNQLLKKKLKLGTSEIPIPPKRDDVTTIEAINRFNKANPRVDTTNLQPLSVKHSNVKKPDEPDMKAEGGRIGYKGAGLVKAYNLLKNLNKTGPVKGLEEKLIKQYKSEGMEFMDAIKKAQTEAGGVRYEAKMKIIDDAMKETNVMSDDYVDLLDMKIKLEDPDFAKDYMNFSETLKNKTRARTDEGWAEANFGDNYNERIDIARSKEINESIDPNITERSLVDDIDDMNVANTDDFFGVRKKNAEGGRIGYNQGSSLDSAVRTVDPVQDSGNKIEEVLKAYGRYQGNRKGKPMSFSKFFELYSTENFAEGGRAGYEDGGMLVQPSDDGSRPGYKDEKNYVSGYSEKARAANKVKFEKTLKEMLKEINGLTQKGYGNVTNIVEKYSNKLGLPKDKVQKYYSKDGSFKGFNFNDEQRKIRGAVIAETKKLNLIDMPNNMIKAIEDYKKLGKEIPRGMPQKIIKANKVPESQFYKTLNKVNLFVKQKKKFKNLDASKKFQQDQRAAALKKYSSDSFERMTRGSKTIQGGHTGDIYNEFVTTSTKAYTPAKINMETLTDADATLKNIGLKRDAAIKAKDFVEVERLNTKGINLSAATEGYKTFKVVQPDGSNYIYGIDQKKTTDPMDLTGNINVQELTSGKDKEFNLAKKRFDAKQITAEEFEIARAKAEKKLFDEGTSKELIKFQKDMAIKNAKIPKKEINRIDKQVKKVMAFCPAGTVKVTKAGGGRVPYADGPVCTPEEAIRGMNEEIDKIKKGKATAGQTSRTLNKLKTIGSIGMGGLLKAGLISEVLYEAAIGFDKVISEGQSPMQAFRQSYLTAPLRGIGVMKSFEEGEREELLDIASDKGKVGRVLDLQDTVLNRDKLINKINNLETSLENQQDFDDGSGFVGNTEPLEKNITELKAQLQDSYRDGQVNRADELFSTNPQDLKIKDQSLMDAYNNAIEKRAVGQASNSFKAQSIAADKNRIRDANKAMIDLGGTYQDYKNPFTKKEYEDFARQKGYLPSDKAYTDKYFTEAILNPMKFEQLMETPGFLGASEKFASGGIASLTKTIPPESGPTPQGLPYVYNNVKKI
ncbi:hypothetical protein OAU35_00310 [bacterium]|nr:hypothetical protein [bacterium]